MEKILILIVAISVLGGVNSLQCYRCTNCTEVRSEQLVTCGANTTVTTTTTTQKPNTTTVSTTTTVTTTRPTNTSTNATTPSTTTSTTTTSTTTTTTTTTSPVTPPSNGTTNSTANVTQENPEALRVRRSAEEDEDNCFCNNYGECNCHGLRIIQFGDGKATESYVCVKDTLQVNGATVINRGCALKHNQTQETCVSSAFSSNCTVCETDQCNGATSINFSILLLAISFFAVVKLV